MKEILKLCTFVGFQVLMTASMKMAVFWVVTPCSLVEIYQFFRNTCCLHHQGALMMEAASNSGTLVNFYQTTWCYNPVDSHLHCVLLCSKKKLLSMTESALLRSSREPVVLFMLFVSCASLKTECSDKMLHDSSLIPEIKQTSTVTTKQIWAYIYRVK
jgi:hypothetical protein